MTNLLPYKKVMHNYNISLYLNYNDSGCVRVHATPAEVVCYYLTVWMTFLEGHNLLDVTCALMGVILMAGHISYVRQLQHTCS